MADIQRQFLRFDEAIRLKRFDENATLREKRDAVLNRLRDRHNAWRREGRRVPVFEPFLQGSYQMGTGVLPADGDYDIDVGLRFDCPRESFSDPVALKTLVFDALKDHTSNVELRRSCVTVFYQRAGEPVYHVDLAVYAQEPRLFGGRELFIAKGKTNSEARLRVWEPSDPEGLVDWVGRRFDGEEQQQFLRVVRALKRWKSEKFKTDGTNAPSGIALTIAAGTMLRPSIQREFFGNKTTPDDVEALVNLTDTMARAFERRGIGSQGTPLYRLAVKLPLTPFADVCERMSDGQMTTFRERLLRLKDALVAARNDLDVATACTRMRGEFGDAFPTG